MQRRGHVDETKLASHWRWALDATGSALPPLPLQFRWTWLAREYEDRLIGFVRSLPDLRAVMDSSATAAMAQTIAEIAGVRPSLDFDNYKHVLREEYGIVKLGSLDTDWSKYALRLRSIYVFQNVKAALPVGDAPPQYLQRLRNQRRLTDDSADNELTHAQTRYAQAASHSVREVFEGTENRLSSILGHPGLGKSTLLQWLALRRAEGETDSLPLLIELRRYVGDLSGHANFLSFLEGGSWTRWQFNHRELNDYLLRHPSLVLFDALDEISDAQRREIVVGEIIRFSRSFPLSRIIVTSRNVGYFPGSKHPEYFRNAGFKHFTLEEFDNKDIYQFIELWHAEAFPNNAAERARYVSRLRRAVDDSPAIRELAANPLLLTMMAILNRKQELPRERTVLYERCCEVLLHDWETDKFPGIREQVSLWQKQRILQEAATKILRKERGVAGTLISEELLTSIISKHLARYGPGIAMELTSKLLRSLQERNHILSFAGDGHYSFVHKTLLEYLCAKEYQVQFEKHGTLTIAYLCQLFRNRCGESGWQEVLKLIAGLIGPKYVAEIVDALLHPDKGWQGVFLSADCLREVRDVDEVGVVRRRTRAELERLLDEASTQSGSLPDSSIVETICLGAIERIARGWREEPETAALLRGMVNGDPRARVREIALQELVNSWRSDAETRKAVESCMRDRERTVRATAVRCLARNWRADASARDLLAEFMRREVDQELVRIAAEGIEQV